MDRGASGYARPVRIVTVLYLAAITAVMVAAGPLVAIIVVVSTFALIVFASRPHWLIYAAFIMAFITLPDVIPAVIPLGAYTARFYEPLLMAGAVWAFFKLPAGHIANNRLLVLSAFLVVFSVFGVVHGNGATEVVKDIRPFVYLLAAFVIGSRIWGTPMMDQLKTQLTWVLWFSFVMILAGSIVGLPLQGRTESTALLDPTNLADGATRLLTATGFLAVVVLCATVALVVARYNTVKEVAYLAVPSFAIVILGFSRNNVLGVAAAVLFALFAARSARSIGVATVAGTSVVVVGLLLVVSGPTLATIPGGAYIDKQVNGFSTRVLGGLTSDTRTTDPSVQYREITENAILRPKIVSEPLAGYGFGYAYKPPSGPEGSFFHDSAPYYAHNYWLWILVKTGVIGTLAFLFGTAGLALGALRHVTRETLALGAPMAAMLVIAFYAPLPNDNPASALVGATAGLLAAALQGVVGDKAVAKVGRKSRRGEATPEPEVRPTVLPV